ncbi:MAG: NfeD family protein [Thermoplasmatota archaeon]
MDYGFGLILVVIAIILFIIEAVEPGFFLAIPAGVLFVLGVIAIIYPELLMTVWTPLIVGIVIIPMMIISMKFYQSISPPTRPTTTMSSSLIGKEGKVVKRVEPDEIKGKVKISNQIWSATSDEPIEVGKKVKVVEARGVHIVVEEIENNVKGG